MKYIQKFNNETQLNLYRKSNFISPHVFLDTQTKNINYLTKFKRLEYISSTQTGAQYIDLGCRLMENTDDIEIDIKFKINDDSHVGYRSIKGNSDATLLNSILEDNETWPGFVLRRTANTYYSYLHNVYLYAKWNFTDSKNDQDKYIMQQI